MTKNKKKKKKQRTKQRNKLNYISNRKTTHRKQCENLCWLVPCTKRAKNRKTSKNFDFRTLSLTHWRERRENTKPNSPKFHTVPKRKATQPANRPSETHKSDDETRKKKKILFLYFISNIKMFLSVDFWLVGHLRNNKLTFKIIEIEIQIRFQWMEKLLAKWKLQQNERTKKKKK